MGAPATLGSLESGVSAAMPSSSSQRTITVDEVIARCGLGPFHLRLLFACGFGFMSAGIEIYALGLLMDGIRRTWVLSEFQLSLLPTLSGVGAILGEFTFGYIADIYGRRNVFMLSVVVMVIFGVASAFSVDMASLVFLRLLVGIGNGATMTVDFPLFAEMLPLEKRGAMLFMLSLFWPVGAFLTAGMAWATIPHSSHGWRIFLLLCAVPSALSLCLRPIIPESPRWLLLQGRKEEAREVVLHMAQFNGKSAEDVGLPDGVRLEVAGENQPLLDPSAAAKEATATQRSLLRILFGADLWRTALGALLFTVLLDLTGYAIQTFLPSFLELKGMRTMGMYQSLMLSTASEFPGIAAGMLLACTLGRIRLIYLSMILLAAAMVVFSLAQTSRVMVISSCFAAGFLEMGWSLQHVYVPEAFPTEVRAFAIGLASGAGSLTSTIIPLINAGLLRRISPSGVVAVYATVTAAGGLVLSLLLNVETLGRNLADKAAR